MISSVKSSTHLVFYGKWAKGSADCTEGDEDELVETSMAARLLKAHEENEAHRERRRALQARAALNARKGFTHWLRAGDLDGMVARGAAHERQRASEGVKGGSFLVEADGNSTDRKEIDTQHRRPCLPPSPPRPQSR